MKRYTKTVIMKINKNKAKIFKKIHENLYEYLRNML